MNLRRLWMVSIIFIWSWWMGKLFLWVSGMRRKVVWGMGLCLCGIMCCLMSVMNGSLFIMVSLCLIWRWLIIRLLVWVRCIVVCRFVRMVLWLLSVMYLLWKLLILFDWWDCVVMNVFGWLLWCLFCWVG